MRKLKSVLLALASLIAGITVFSAWLTQNGQANNPTPSGRQETEARSSSTTYTPPTDSNFAANTVQTAASIAATRGNSNEPQKVLTTPLAKIYEAALLSKAPEQRSLAFWMSATCLTLAPARSSSNAGQTNGEIEKKVGNDTALKVKHAFETLESYCKTGNAEEFTQALRRKSDAPMLSAVERDIHAESQRPQEYLQAATTVLSSPTQYPFQFNYWLNMSSHQAVVKEFELTSEQFSLVQDAVFRKFITDEGVINFRNLQRCAYEERCGQRSADYQQDSIVAARVADVIEKRIREQRWDLLLKQPQ